MKEEKNENKIIHIPKEENTKKRKNIIHISEGKKEENNLNQNDLIQLSQERNERIYKNKKNEIILSSPEKNKEKKEESKNINNNHNEIKNEENNKNIKIYQKEINNKRNINLNPNNSTKKKIIDRVVETDQIEIIDINDNKSKELNNDKKEKENEINKSVEVFKRNSKDSSLIYPKDFDKFSEKGENIKRRHLIARVSTKREINDLDFNNYEDSYDNFFNKPNKSNKIEKFQKDDFFKNETNSMVPFKEGIFPRKKNNFYSDVSSSQFINPLKYLKRSFQKRQEEKFGCDDSDENSNSKSDFEELESFNNNSIKLIDQINDNDMAENENLRFDRNIYKENQEKNQRTRNSGDTKESTESHQEDKNISLRQKYKNNRKYY